MVLIHVRAERNGTEGDFPHLIDLFIPCEGLQKAKAGQGPPTSHNGENKPLHLTTVSHPLRHNDEDQQVGEDSVEGQTGAGRGEGEGPQLRRQL